MDMPVVNIAGRILPGFPHCHGDMFQAVCGQGSKVQASLPQYKPLPQNTTIPRETWSTGETGQPNEISDDPLFLGQS